MENQVLSLEQMNQLKELGVDTSRASMAIYSIYAGEEKEYNILAANGVFAEKQEHDRFGYGIHNVVSFDKKPVFTSQDIIELLPREVTDYADYQLLIDKQRDSYSVSYENTDSFLVSFCRVELLDCLYEMLLWVIDNDYLETK